MKSRSRITGRRASAESSRTEADSKPTNKQLSALLRGCFIADIKPDMCIPLWLIRKRQNNAVAKIKCLLTGNSKSPSAIIQGYVSGSPSSVVIALVDELHELLVDYWESLCDTKEEAADIMKQHPIWYGIVDGCHFHAAVTELQNEQREEWIDFLWKVTVIRHEPKLSNLCRLDRVQNERNKPMYTFDVTIYDLLYNLRREYELLKKERSTESRTRTVSVSSRDVADAYDGAEHRTNTSIRQAACIALKLHPRTIEAIGAVNTSCADFIVKSKDLNTLSLETEEEILAHQDCRLFKSFVCFGAFRSASFFLKAVETGDIEAQVNTIHRMRHHCEINNYKPVQSKTVAEQFQLAKQALEEEATFFKIIGEKSGPSIWKPLMRISFVQHCATRNPSLTKVMMETCYRPSGNASNHCIPLKPRTLRTTVIQ